MGCFGILVVGYESLIEEMGILSSGACLVVCVTCVPRVCVVEAAAMCMVKCRQHVHQPASAHFLCAACGGSSVVLGRPLTGW